jgi:hypothetical protein
MPLHSTQYNKAVFINFVPRQTVVYEPPCCLRSLAQHHFFKWCWVSFARQSELNRKCGDIVRENRIADIRGYHIFELRHKFIRIQTMI